MDEPPKTRSSRLDLVRATYAAKPQTTAQLEAASSWTREAGGASRWAFRLSKTPLLARFHSNGDSGRLDEVRGRRRWVGVLVVVDVKNLRYKNPTLANSRLAL